MVGGGGEMMGKEKEGGSKMDFSGGRLRPITK